AHAARARTLAEAPGASHRHESVHVAELDVHCSEFRTACSDCTGLSRGPVTAIVGVIQSRRQIMTRIDPSSTFTLGDRTVKRIGYGAMQLAGPGVFGPPKDHDKALAVLREVAAAGVNHIDTSDFYGPHVTNKLIREALAPYPDDLVIVTKIGARRGEDGSWLPAFSPDALTQAVHDNLRNLGLEFLEIVNL